VRKALVFGGIFSFLSFSLFDDFLNSLDDGGGANAIFFNQNLQNIELMNKGSRSIGLVPCSQPSPLSSLPPLASFTDHSCFFI
jgi:hypothetical protein